MLKMNEQFSKRKTFSRAFTKIELADIKINRTSIAILNIMNAFCCINIQAERFASYDR